MTWSPLLPLLARVEFESLLTLCGMMIEKAKIREEEGAREKMMTLETEKLSWS